MIDQWHLPKTLCIVIPSYNEEKNFRLREYVDFLNNHPSTLLCFVNNGSTDETLLILESLKDSFNEQVDILSFTKNLKKAEALCLGMVHCHLKYDYELMTFLDANLPVSFEECISVPSQIRGYAGFAFGLGIMKNCSIIEPNLFRFSFARIIAIGIRAFLKLKIYETRCGCKVFAKKISKLVFDRLFVPK